MALTLQVTPSLSFQKILDLCRKNGNFFGSEDVTIDKVIGTPIITILSEDKGFISHVYRIEFKTSYGSYSIVAKIPSTKNFEPSYDIPKEQQQQQRQISFQMVSELHSNEIAFYELYSKYPEVNLKIPKYIYGQEMTDDQEGLILMEDLSKKCGNGQSFKGLQYLTDCQIKESITEISKLQAWGFSISNSPVILGKIDTLKIVLNQVFIGSLNKLANKKYSWLTEKRLKKLKKAAEIEEFDRACMGNYILPLVLSHDDFWAGNLLFSADSGNLVTILDWQMARFASSTQDLAALLALGLTGHDRRRLERGYLQFYYETLKHYFNAHQCSQSWYESFTFEDLHRVYRVSLKTAIFRVILTWENYDTANPPPDGSDSETPLENAIRCLIEDLEDEM